LRFGDCQLIARHGMGQGQALSIKNTDIVRELSLPPVKIHCSVLAEDAIKAAIGDWKKKHGVEVPAAERASH
jgi:nitrogen fixation NifU-like protein